mgnify:CR=1 FL=1
MMQNETREQPTIASPAPIDERQLRQMLDFVPQLSVDERSLLKLNLSEQIPLYFDQQNRLRQDDPQLLRGFHALAELLRMLTPQAAKIPSNGIVYRGFPEWLSVATLARLQAEAYQRRDQPLDRSDHFLGCGGTVADSLSVNPQVLEFMRGLIGPTQATGIASYLYYDNAGLGIRPHVDTEVFSVNLMLMLRHECKGDFTPSATVAFPAYSEPEAYRLRIGEVMVMHGSSVIHTRSVVQQGEDIHLLTIGFNRILAGDAAVEAR